MKTYETSKKNLKIKIEFPNFSNTDNLSRKTELRSVLYLELKLSTTKYMKLNSLRRIIL